jgi:hypothetical protein
MAELGAPEDLGRELRRVHRPNRWVNLLLALVPYGLLSPLITLLVSAFYGPLSAWSPVEPHLYLGGRIAIIAQALLALVGRQRRSVELTLFWISCALASLISLMTRERRFLPGQEAAVGTPVAGSWFESLLWYALLAALFAGLALTLSRARFDRLLVTFALLPLLLAAANYGTGQVLVRGLGSHQPGYLLELGLLGTLLYRGAWILGMALFFLLTRRDLRWLGVLLMVFSFAAPNLSEYQGSLTIGFIWSGWLALVILIWYWDWAERGGGFGRKRGFS